MPVTIRTEGLVDRERLKLTLQLLREAGDTGLTKAQLCRKLGSVSSRTVDRAVGLLEAQGARISKPRRGRPAVIHFILDKGPSWDEHVSADARLALRVATLSLSQTGTALWGDKLQALEALASEHMSNRDRQVFQSLQRAIRVQGGVDDPIEVPTVLEPILKALEQGRALELEYDSASSRQTATYEVVPYALTHDLFSGGAFLLAWDSTRNRIAHFRLGRIQKARSLRIANVPDKAQMEQSARFQVGGWTSDAAPFTIQACISGTGWVQALKEAPPALPGFRSEPDAAGESTRVTFQANHAAGASRWLLQFGEACEVLEPEWLRTDIRQRLEAALRRYRDRS